MEAFALWCEDAYTKEEKRRLEMNVLKKITNFVSRYMAAIVILMAMIALFAPSSVSFIKTSYVNTLLGIVMFGMGLTLKPDDFKVVFSRPKDVIIGCIAQFTIMPLLAFGLTKLFHRYDLPFQRRCGTVRWYDFCINDSCSVPDTAADQAVCRTDGRCECSEHVRIHH